MNYKVEVKISLKDDNENTLTDTTITLDPNKVPSETYGLVQKVLLAAIKDGVDFSTYNDLLAEEGE